MTMTMRDLKDPWLDDEPSWRGKCFCPLLPLNGHHLCHTLIVEHTANQRRSSGRYCTYLRRRAMAPALQPSSMKISMCPCGTTDLPGPLATGVRDLVRARGGGRKLEGNGGLKWPSTCALTCTFSRFFFWPFSLSLSLMSTGLPFVAIPPQATRGPCH